MPHLDVSFVVQDPMLADTFKVHRWANKVNDSGRLVPTLVGVFDPVTGVVTQQSPSALMNKDDMTIIPRRIFVASVFRFRASTQDPETGEEWQPDRIIWEGTTYKVVDVLPYSKYGRGICEVIAESQTAVDNPQ